MKRLLAIAAWVLLAATPALAQQQHWGLHLNGWGGFGFNWANSSTEQMDNLYRDLGGDISLDASGFVYDPRLVTFDTIFSWNRLNSSLTQGNSGSSGWNLSTGLSFLSERSFPFTVFYSRTNQNAESDLFPLYTTINTQWGIRGSFKRPGSLGNFFYNFTNGSNRSDLSDGAAIETRYRNLSVSWNRPLKGWDLHAGADFNRLNNDSLVYSQNTRTFTFDAGRNFGERLRLDTNFMHSRFSFQDENSGSSDTGVTTAVANLTWKHTSKLDSYYSAAVSLNGVNAIRLESETGGGSNPLPFSPIVSNSSAQNIGAGMTYRATENLTLQAAAGFSHNSLPGLTNLTLEQQSSLTTGVMNAGGGYSYRHTLKKLLFHSSGTVALQRYSMLNGLNYGSGVGYSLENGLSGGNPRTLRFSGSFRLAHRNNPVFFNASSTTDTALSGHLDTQRLKLFQISLTANYSMTDLELVGSKLNLTRTSYTVMATRPKLSLYYSRTSSNGNERFFSLLPLQTPQARAQAAIVPDPLLRFVATELSGQRLGVVWRPKSNLLVEGRYDDSDYVFTQLGGTESRYKHFDVLATWKVGRFTVFGGFGHLSNATQTFGQDTNRVYVRVRFPFHIL